jgi:hypothetical protein
MHTILNNTLSELKDSALKLGKPDDEYKSHYFLSPLQLHRHSKLHYKLSLLIDTYVQATQGQRGPNQLEVFRQHWQWVLLGLSRVIFMNSWLVVSLDTKAYSSDIWLKRYEIKYSSVKPIIDYLKEQGLIELLTGKRYKGNPARTRIYPTPALVSQIWEYFLDQEQPIEGPYLTINETDDIWQETMFKVKSDSSHPDMDDMIAINEFLKPHQWACKAPVRLVYKHTPFQGGRLVTPFQNLPDRRARIRINTQIDGQPICEVDYNANHLRLNLALFAKEYAGETPYEDICIESGVASRDMVKKFITVAMGASSEMAARNSLARERFNGELFNRINAGVQKRYPKLKLFNGWGIFAQNLEGQILKDVMLEGIKEDIVCLPVHDAIAVQQQHQQWAKEVMLETWQAHLDGVGTKVKVDLP